MAKAKNNHHLYVGRAGHLASMAECLSRGWNVAIPEVDVGEDIFVVEDETSTLRKVQVKAATGKKMKFGFKAQFKVPKRQIDSTTPKGDNLYFVFVVRYKRAWYPYTIMTRKELYDKHYNEHVGTVTKKEEVMLTLYYSYTNIGIDKVLKVECGTQKGFSGKDNKKPDLTSFVDTWDKLFSIRITQGNEI